MRPLFPRWCVALGAAIAIALSASAADWPHWRGPNRSGITDESSGWTGKAWLAEKPTWTAKVGEGASSPLALGDNVITFGHAGGKDVIRCLHAATGKENWSVEYKAPKYGRFHMGDEGLYSGPSSTPEYDAETGFLYTLSADGDLNCWNAHEKGKKVWGKNLYDDFKVERRPQLTRAPRRDYGYTSSPMIHGEWLLVEVGSTTRGTLVAFDRKTGKEAWASELKDEAGHTGGPARMDVDGVRCVALLTQRNLAVIGLDGGKQGKTIALFEWVTDFANTIAGPAVQGDEVLIAAGYNHNAMVKVKITPVAAKEVWRKKYPSKVCTPVIDGKHIYVAWQRVRCLSWETGELKWEGGVIGDPGSCVVTSDGRLVVYGDKGKLMLIEGAGRSPDAYKELAVKDKLFASAAWPHVVLASGRVFCRDRDGNLASFGMTK